jgi:hypothetical protein
MLSFVWMIIETLVLYITLLHLFFLKNIYETNSACAFAGVLCQFWWMSWSISLRFGCVQSELLELHDSWAFTVPAFLLCGNNYKWLTCSLQHYVYNNPPIPINILLRWMEKDAPRAKPREVIFLSNSLTR